MNFFRKSLFTKIISYVVICCLYVVFSKQPVVSILSMWNTDSIVCDHKALHFLDFLMNRSGHGPLKDFIEKKCSVVIDEAVRQIKEKYSREELQRMPDVIIIGICFSETKKSLDKLSKNINLEGLCNDLARSVEIGDFKSLMDISQEFNILPNNESDIIQNFEKMGVDKMRWTLKTIAKIILAELQVVLIAVLSTIATYLIFSYAKGRVNQFENI